MISNMSFNMHILSTYWNANICKLHMLSTCTIVSVFIITEFIIENVRGFAGS